MEISVVSRSGKDMGAFKIDETTTVDDFKAQFHAANKKFYPSR
jgi:hypothetical protein